MNATPTGPERMTRIELGTLELFKAIRASREPNAWQIMLEAGVLIAAHYGLTDRTHQVSTTSTYWTGRGS
jgi:hypothetical protein